MNDDLYHEQIKLEEEARGLTIKKFHKDHLEASKDDTFSETFIGNYLLKHYINPFSSAIEDFVSKAFEGRAGKNNRTAKNIAMIDAPTAAFLMTKAILNKVGAYRDDKPTTVTSLAILGAGLIHDEIRLRTFEDEHARLSKRIHGDFDKRELRRDKREEYMQKAFDRMDMEWSIWSKTEMVRIGVTLLHLFRMATGDVNIESFGTGRTKRDIVVPSDGLLDTIDRTMGSCEALMTTHFPMVIPPLDWSEDTMNSGSYLTTNITPYPLVKSSKRGYRQLLKELTKTGQLGVVLNSLNTLQRTEWSINTRVLDVIEDIYLRNIPCGKLPSSDKLQPDPPPAHLVGLDKDHPEVKEYRAYAFRIHEHNRRIIGKRVMAMRAFQLARKFSEYDVLYFPYDLDSRGRAYPKPSGLNPQGPDYVKGLLQFATPKALGTGGVFWLGVHGANSWGEDKLPIHERAQWALDNLERARRVAGDPRENLEWTEADNPAQFLAWCFEWAEAHATGSPEEYQSRLHVDLDATCSGLQHFAAMLRDEKGGFYVNMTPNDTRQDVYGAVANEALELIRKDLTNPEVHTTTNADGEVIRSITRSNLAQSWLDFGMSRKVTKRPVMVKPYAGTRSSCNQYVAEAVDEALKSGVAMPVHKDDIWTFKMYGSGKVWDAIPAVVVAADGAMKWLMDITKLVGKSQPVERRIEWTTPVGLPVHQYKFDTVSRQVKTFFDGSIIRPRITEDLDTLDPRKMATSVAPSFVHSLDAAHLQLTVHMASIEGIKDFAVVHDSFGVHAADVTKFSRIIREAFVKMYTEHDVLEEFLDAATPLISEDLQHEIPPIPERGDLDLQGVLDNPFFFS
jgi:DNA-directed RNA polymerase, mitochondrial